MGEDPGQLRGVARDVQPGRFNAGRPFMGKGDTLIDDKTKGMFSRCRVKRGYCLGHVRVIRRMNAPEGFLLCQGPLLIDSVQGQLDKPFLHCWIEKDDTVIDLTRRPAFCVKSNYYTENGILASDVKRYTQSECWRLGRKAKGNDEFWEFDTNKFWVKQAGAAWPAQLERSVTYGSEGNQDKTPGALRN